MTQPKNFNFSNDEGRDWYIGAQVTRKLQQQLKNEAKAEKRSLSQQLILILEERYTTSNANEKETKETNGT